MANPQKHGNSVNRKGNAVKTNEDRTVLMTVSQSNGNGACINLCRLKRTMGNTKVVATKGSCLFRDTIIRLGSNASRDAPH